MNTKLIWVGLAACWLVVGVIVALFFVGEDDSPLPETTASELSQNLEDSDDPELLKHDPVQYASTPDDGATDDPNDETSNKHGEVAEASNNEPAEPNEESSDSDAREAIRVESGSTTKTSNSSVGTVSVPQGGKLVVSGEVKVDGDWINKGTVDAGKATLVFDGADQTIEGNTTAGKIILRGGTKRIRSGRLATSSHGNAEPGEAQLVVEAGTTLIIEKDGKWRTPNPYGFHIEGRLVIDGGEFHCSFSNGNGTDRGAESWVEGSELIIYSGKFVGDGDADFSGCAITIHDGSLEIDDDIWNSGSELTIYGGLMRNTTGGGMFYLTGTVNISGGELRVNQNSSRSLRVAKGATVFCTGGKIILGGRDASTGGGILLGEGATLPDITMQVSTRIHEKSNPDAWLTIGGTLEIAKGRRFEANGHDVFTNFIQTEESGEFIP